MIDIGVNLTSNRFDVDRQDVVDAAIAAGVAKMLITGTSVEESHQALAIAQQIPTALASTAGIHPHYADDASDDFIEQLTALSTAPEVKAIGECGLDFNRNFSTPENQMRVFKAQITLAEKLQMPLFLHQRDAFSEWFECLTPAIGKVPAMISHCFTGNISEMQQCIEAGMYIGVTGWVCDERRGADLQAAVRELPLERLMIETDAPYLTPRTIRPRPKSSRNEPKYLRYVAEKVAALKSVAVEEVVAHATANSERVFAL